jgi:heme-degrading monooxygenase HmoA
MSAGGIARTPAPPYYAVVFTSRRSTADEEGYARTAEEMETLVARQPGYLGMESVRGADRVGITVAYFADPPSIAAWKQQEDHRVAQRLGRERWYEAYSLRVCRVERAYGWTRDAQQAAG